MRQGPHMLKISPLAASHNDTRTLREGFLSPLRGTFPTYFSCKAFRN